MPAASRRTLASPARDKHPRNGARGVSRQRRQTMFHCRTELFEALGRLAVSRRMNKVAYGAIVDDLGDDRPGMRAAEEHGVSPRFSTRVWERGKCGSWRPPTGCPCGTSRRPPAWRPGFRGTEVTPARLAQVEHAERALRSLGFVQVRVRHHGDGCPDRGRRGKWDDSGGTDQGAVVELVRAAGFRS